jgi:hypothetical protein
MAETNSISEIAKKVSDDIFNVFGWERRPPRDRNWDCVTEKHKKKTHPSDVVFCYEDPVEHSTIFFTTDLKSYAQNTISLDKIKAALKSLAMSVECAAKSAQWRDLYVNPTQNYKVHGLLFLYNHDGGFHEELSTYIKDISSSSIRLRRFVRLLMIGPREINYLITVATDIKCERGDKNLPSAENCSFFYPDLVRVRVKSNLCKAATIEMLTGPWQILRFERGGPDQNRNGFHFYYGGLGETPEEFKYIFDYLFRQQMVHPQEVITIRMARACAAAKLTFENAKEQYAMDFFPYVKVEDIKRRLSTINFARINTAIKTFSDLDIGME